MKALIKLSIVVAVLVSSCTVEKRLHLSGHNINWKNSNSEQLEKLVHRDINIVVPAQKRAEVNLASANTSESNLADFTIEPSRTLALDSSSLNKCDTIMLKNGNKILCVIQEIGLSEIKYKYCNYVDGPSLVVAKKTVDALVHRNGQVEKIALAEAEQTKSTAKRKFEWFGLASFVISCIAAVVGYSSIISTMSYSSSGQLELYLPALLFGGLIAMALGIYSTYLTKTKQDKYMRGAFATLGMIFGTIIASISALLMYASQL